MNPATATAAATPPTVTATGRAARPGCPTGNARPARTVPCPPTIRHATSLPPADRRPARRGRHGGAGADLVPPARPAGGPPVDPLADGLRRRQGRGGQV